MRYLQGQGKIGRSNQFTGDRISVFGGSIWGDRRTSLTSKLKICCNIYLASVPIARLWFKPPRSQAAQSRRPGASSPGNAPSAARAPAERRAARFRGAKSVENRLKKFHFSYYLYAIAVESNNIFAFISRQFMVILNTNLFSVVIEKKRLPSRSQERSSEAPASYHGRSA